MRDVAEYAGVSVSLVSSFVNSPHLVGAASRERIEAAIDELGWVPNSAARQLRSGVSTMVGFVAYDISDPLFIAVSRGAKELARDHGMSVVLADSDGEVAQESHYLSLFVQQRVRGLLVSPVEVSSQFRAEIRRARVPLVLVDAQVPDDDFWSISVNDERGGYLAAEHLVSIGRRRIAVVGGPITVRQVADRLAGARAAAAVGGAEVEYIETTDRSVDTGRQVAEALLNRPADQLPDAVFCINDLIASGLAERMLAGNVAVPQDLAIIGYNDTSELTTAPLPLSSIRQPHEAFGHAAVGLLLEQLSPHPGTPRQVIFEPELITRRSTIG